MYDIAALHLHAGGLGTGSLTHLVILQSLGRRPLLCRFTAYKRNPTLWHKGGMVNVSKPNACYEASVI